MTPEVDWSTIPVGTKVMVRNFACDEWEPRRFSHFRNGKVYVFSEGITNSSWWYTKLAE